MPSKTNDFAFSNKQSSRVANSKESANHNQNIEWSFNTALQSILSNNKFVLYNAVLICCIYVSIFVIKK
jgi:hypothetical protein